MRTQTKGLLVSWVALASLGAIGIPRRALAFDAQAFAPAVDPTGYFSIYSSGTAPKGRYHVAAWYDWAHDVSEFGGQKVVGDVHTLDVVASYSLLNWLALGIDVPVSKVTSDLPQVKDGFGIDDIRLVGKLSPSVDPSGRFGIALVSFVDLPTGNDERLTSTTNTTFGFIGVFDFTLERFRTSLNLGYKVDPASGSDPDEVLFGLGLGYTVFRRPSEPGRPLQLFRPDRIELIGEVFGSTARDDFFERQFTTPVEGLTGVRLSCERGFFFQAGVGKSATDSVNGASLRVVSSIGYALPVAPAVAAAAPAPPPPPRFGQVVVTDEQIVTLEMILFDTGKATIRPRSYATVDQVMQVMRDRPGIHVRIEGHTDSVGSEAANQKLSQRRAESVRVYLVDHGVARERLEAVGYGETRPIATNATKEGRQQNRRTEFHILK
jgi:outer membrane protein OmpA-like peptidoglycan-associated protein